MSSMTPRATGSLRVRGTAKGHATRSATQTPLALAHYSSISESNHYGHRHVQVQQVIPPTSRAKRRSAWIVLRQRNFRIYFFGALASNLGTWLQSTVQILIAYQLTHSVFAVGAITSAQFTGMVLLSPWAAVVADRVGTKTLLIGTQSASALIAIDMAWSYHSGTLGVYTLFFGSLGLGLAYALALPVQTALLPSFVRPEDTTAAAKMTSVSYNAGRAMAPALYVLATALVGRELIFLLNGASFMIFSGCLAVALCGRASASRKIDRAVLNPASQSSPHRRARITDGLLTALHQPRIILLLAIVAAVTLADDPVLVLSPALSQARLHLSSDWTVYFIAALGWGSVGGSLLPTSTQANSPKSASRRAAISLLVLGLSVLVFALGLSAPVSLLADGAAGAAGLFAGSAAQAALLRHHEGKSTNLTAVAGVAALWAVAWAGTKPFASLLDGWLASNIGIVPTTEVLVAPAILIAFFEIFLPEAAKSQIRLRVRGIIVSPSSLVLGSNPSPVTRRSGGARSAVGARRPRASSGS